MKDTEIKQMLKYLAWSQRCNSHGNVIDKAVKYMSARPIEFNPVMVSIYAELLQRILESLGPVGAYQQFIEDDSLLCLLSHVLNRGDL